MTTTPRKKPAVSKCGPDQRWVSDPRAKAPKREGQQKSDAAEPNSSSAENSSQQMRVKIGNALKPIIESVYTSGITKVLTYKFDPEGNVTGRFHDEDDVFTFSISVQGEIDYKLLDAQGGRSDSYLIGYYADSGLLLWHDAETRADKSGATRKKCSIGINCGDTCINRNNNCRVKLNALAAERFRVVSQAGARMAAPAAGSSTPAQTQKPAQTQGQTEASPQPRQADQQLPDIEVAVANAAGLAGIKLTTAAYTMAAAAMLGIGVNAGVTTVQTDLSKLSEENAKKAEGMVVMPETGPTPEILAEWDKMEPGDMIRKAFTNAHGTFHHYGVYGGKDPKTGQHMVYELTDLPDNFGNGRPVFQYSPMYDPDRKSNSINTAFAKVPKEELNLRKGQEFSREEIIQRAQSLVGLPVTYRSFRSNCETMARLVVEGETYGVQQDAITPFTATVTQVLVSALLTVGSAPEAVTGRLGISRGGKFIGLSDYAVDRNKIPAGRIAKLLRSGREDELRSRIDQAAVKLPRKPQSLSGDESWSLPLLEEATQGGQRADAKEGAESIPFSGEMDAFAIASGLKPMSDYSQNVEGIAQAFPAQADEIRVDMYTNYLMFALGVIAESARAGVALPKIEFD